MKFMAFFLSILILLPPAASSASYMMNVEGFILFNTITEEEQEEHGVDDDEDDRKDLHLANVFYLIDAVYKIPYYSDLECKLQTQPYFENFLPPPQFSLSPCIS